MKNFYAYEDDKPKIIESESSIIINILGAAIATLALIGLLTIIGLTIEFINNTL